MKLKEPLVATCTQFQLSVKMVRFLVFIEYGLIFFIFFIAM
jgi:hypothetical protein